MILLNALFALALLFLVITAVNVLAWPGLRRARDAGGILDLSVLIPARNEESNLPRCLEEVLKQPVREILVYDDHSTDMTAHIVCMFARRDPRVRLVPMIPLPAGWFGKTFACSRLAAEATSEWLLFLDADARPIETACTRMVGEARRRRLTLLSCWPGFDTFTLAEKALMPMLNWVVFSVFPGPLSLIRQDRSLALAHGACLLARRETYEQVGGHAAVRTEIFEDTRIAQLWRERGERSLCLDGQDVIRVRMYSSVEEIWKGFQKNFFLAFRHEFSFWAFLALHLLVFLLPFLILEWKAVSAIFAARALLAVRYRQDWWSIPLHPLGELFILALGISSWRASRSGKGVSWKGRNYGATRA